MKLSQAGGGWSGGGALTTSQRDLSRLKQCVPTGGSQPKSSCRVRERESDFRHLYGQATRFISVFSAKLQQNQFGRRLYNKEKMLVDRMSIVLKNQGLIFHAMSCKFPQKSGLEYMQIYIHQINFTAPQLYLFDDTLVRQAFNNVKL